MPGTKQVNRGSLLVTVGISCDDPCSQVIGSGCIDDRSHPRSEPVPAKELRVTSSRTDVWKGRERFHVSLRREYPAVPSHLSCEVERSLHICSIPVKMRTAEPLALDFFKGPGHAHSEPPQERREAQPVEQHGDQTHR